MIKNSALKAGATALAALAVGFGVAACGSSTKVAKGVVLAPGEGATVAAVTTTATTAAAPTATTPTSGPLSKEPTAGAPQTKLPKTLVRTVETAGTGMAVASGDSIEANFYGYDYKTGKAFEGGSSWTSTTASTPSAFQIGGTSTTGAASPIEGWIEGLVGVKAGSRVKLIIPPSLAYKGTSSPLAKDTLVFVIDVLSVTKG